MVPEAQQLKTSLGWVSCVSAFFCKTIQSVVHDVPTTKSRKTDFRDRYWLAGTCTMEGKVQFGTVDFAVFGVMLLLSAAIGIYHAFTGGKQRTTKEFLFANRGMMGIPVALSLLASFMSAITILGVPSEIYIFGTQYWLIIASYVILFPSVALIFVPVFRAVEISSSYEVS